MKKTILLIAAFAFLVSAQQPDSTQTYNWSLLFGIAENLRLTNFQGGSIALERQITEDFSARAVLGLEGYDNNGTSDNQQTSINGDITSDIDGSTKRSTYQFALLGLYTFVENGRVALYAGIGPEYIYYDREVDNLSYNYDLDTLRTIQKSDDNYYNHRYGAKMVVGVRLTVISQVSLIGEYYTGFYYQTGDSESTRTTEYQDSQYDDVVRENSSTGDGVRYDNFQVKFGIAIHF